MNHSRKQVASHALFRYDASMTSVERIKRKTRTTQELYQVMHFAIDYMREHAMKKPSIEAVAKVIGMSTSRFEHMFAEWAGTSPKRFLSYLLKEKAKKNLNETQDILRTAYSSGLSGPNRLHELMVTYEAVSPGEFKKGNIEITYGLQPSPFGWCLIGLTKRGICQLSFVNTNNQTEAVKIIKEVWPHSILIRNDARIAPYVKKIFKAERLNTPIRLLLKGTNFQIKVWEALLKIPQGDISSYAKIADAVGSPKAVRAVGTACGKNSIAFLIPCHRVLTSAGKLGGYHWGIERKEAILAWEAVRQSGNKE